MRFVPIGCRATLRHSDLPPLSRFAPPLRPNCGHRPPALRGHIRHTATRNSYVKIGQVFSNRRDVLPIAYVSQLSTLQDNVTARPWPVVKRSIERSLRAPVSRHFSSVDPKPLGCASVAQVHRATITTASGRNETVVIKVQHARARALFAVDLWNVELLMKLVRAGSPGMRGGSLVLLEDQRPRCASWRSGGYPAAGGGC